MSSDVDAVITALRIVLQEAEARHNEFWWQVHVVNRWIDQLPGAWWGRWRRLRLRGDNYDGTDAKRDNLITHVRATLAYLETNRDAIAAQRRSWWRLGQAASPGPGKGKDVAAKLAGGSQAERVEPSAPKPKWLN